MQVAITKKLSVKKSLIKFSPTFYVNFFFLHLPSAKTIESLLCSAQSIFSLHPVLFFLSLQICAVSVILRLTVLPLEKSGSFYSYTMLMGSKVKVNLCLFYRKGPWSTLAAQCRLGCSVCYSGPCRHGLYSRSFNILAADTINFLFLLFFFFIFFVFGG